jgi:hypothetical protein
MAPKLVLRPARQRFAVPPDPHGLLLARESRRAARSLRTGRRRLPIAHGSPRNVARQPPLSDGRARRPQTGRRVASLVVGHPVPGLASEQAGLAARNRTRSVLRGLSVSSIVDWMPPRRSCRRPARVTVPDLPAPSRWRRRHGKPRSGSTTAPFAMPPRTQLPEPSPARYRRNDRNRSPCRRRLLLNCSRPSAPSGP